MSKKPFSIHGTAGTARGRWSAVWQCYTVWLYDTEGRQVPDSSYETDDYDDAVRTAKLMSQGRAI